MNFISLFSGIGGFDLGFERAGMNCVAQVEIDKNCKKLLADKWQNVERYSDVKAVGKSNLPSAEVICGGFPCQDLSISGNREGLAGDRSGLWFEFARIIEELSPRWVVIENVPGLLSSNKGRDFAVILQGMEKFGYGVAWRVLDAQYFGVPQRRRRVFIVGSLGNGSAAEVLFEREGVCWNTPSRRETVESSAGTFTIRAGKDGGGKGYLGQESLAMTLGGQQQLVTGTLDHKSCASNRGCQANETDFLVMSTGQSNAEIVIDGSPSITCAHEQPILNGIRRLTPLECERLQGFPDNWTTGFSDSVRYKMLGNAVAVPVVRWIGNRIMMVEEAAA